MFEFKMVKYVGHPVSLRVDSDQLILGPRGDCKPLTCLQSTVVLIHLFKKKG